MQLDRRKEYVCILLKLQGDTDSSQWHSLVQMGVLDLPASTPKVVQKISEERKRKVENNVW